jgi:hypothetical protein
MIKFFSGPVYRFVWCRSLAGYVDKSLQPVADDPCRDAGADGHGRQIGGDHGACSYDRAFSNGYSSGYHYVGAEPYVIANADGGIASRLIANQFTAGYSMIGGDDRGARAKEHVVPDGDRAARRGPHGTEVVDEGVVADLDQLGVFKEDGRENFGPLSQPLKSCFTQVVAACDQGKQVEPSFNYLCDRSDHFAPGRQT